MFIRRIALFLALFTTSAFAEEPAAPSSPPEQKCWGDLEDSDHKRSYIAFWNGAFHNLVIGKKFNFLLPEDVVLKEGPFASSEMSDYRIEISVELPCWEVDPYRAESDSIVALGGLRDDAGTLHQVYILRPNQSADKMTITTATSAGVFEGSEAWFLHLENETSRYAGLHALVWKGEVYPKIEAPGDARPHVENGKMCYVAPFKGKECIYTGSRMACGERVTELYHMPGWLGPVFILQDKKGSRVIHLDYVSDYYERVKLPENDAFGDTALGIADGKLSVVMPRAKRNFIGGFSPLAEIDMLKFDGERLFTGDLNGGGMAIVWKTNIIQKADAIIIATTREGVSALAPPRVITNDRRRQPEQPLFYLLIDGKWHEGNFFGPARPVKQQVVDLRLLP